MPVLKTQDLQLKTLLFHIQCGAKVPLQLFALICIILFQHLADDLFLRI